MIQGGTMNIKWDNLLKKIRADPEKFIREENGWGAFFSESDAAEEEDVESGDSEFKTDEEKDGEGEGEDEDFDDEDYDDEDDELESLVDEEGGLTRGRVGGKRRGGPQEKEQKER